MTTKAPASKLFFLLATLFGVCIQAHAQTIRYSRQTIEPPSSYDRMELLPGAAGTYHLLFFEKDAPLALYSFDRDMQPGEKKSLPIRYASNAESQVIPFKNFSFLYLHKRGSTEHELWKIDAQGNAASFTQAFQNLLDTALKTKAYTVHLMNDNGQLVLFASTYYDEAKLLATTVVRTDENLTTASSQTIAYDFDRQQEMLHQSLFIGGNLYLLQSARRGDRYAIEIIKAELGSDKLFRKGFESRENFTRGATFRYVPGDSSLLILSVLGPQLFTCRVNLSLELQTQPTLVAAKSRNAVPTNYLLLSGEAQQWVFLSAPVIRFARSNNQPLYSTPPASRYRSNTIGPMSQTLDGFYSDQYSMDRYRNGTMAYGSESLDYYASRGNSRYVMSSDDIIKPPVRFSVVDKAGKPIGDSVINNEKGPATVSGASYATVTIGGRSCLLLRQEFSRSKRGLLLVSVDGNNQIAARDISVYDKYEYVLQKAQAYNGVVVMPFIQRSQLGLVKLSFDN